MSLDEEVKGMSGRLQSEAMQMQREQLILHREHLIRQNLIAKDNEGDDKAAEDWIKKYAKDYRQIHDVLVSNAILLNLGSKETIDKTVHNYEQEVFDYKYRLSQKEGRDVGLIYAFKQWTLQQKFNP